MFMTTVAPADGEVRRLLVRKSATVRRVPAAPIDESFYIGIATDALTSVITELRCRVEQMGTPRSVAQVLLAEAHIAEAVGLLRAIRPAQSAGEADFHLPSPGPSLHARNRVQGAGRRHQPQRVAV